MKIGLAFILVGNLLVGSCCLPIREPGRLVFILLNFFLSCLGRGAGGVNRWNLLTIIMIIIIIVIIIINIMR